MTGIGLRSHNIAPDTLFGNSKELSLLFRHTLIDTLLLHSGAEPLWLCRNIMHFRGRV